MFAILVIESYANEYLILTLEYTLIHISYLKLSMQFVKFQNFLGNLQRLSTLFSSPRFLCRPMAFFSTCWSCGTSESSTYGKQRICPCNSALAHFHVSWLSDFIFYPKPLYKSLHHSFFYSFITILPSESGATLHYSTILS